MEIYTHRTGRTGRADKSGVAISIVNYREKSKIPQIEKLIGKKCEKASVPDGKEICEKQLFKLIDKMEKVEVDEVQISPFMDVVNKKLEWLSKEEIIKRFVSLEFNRFLEYYKNAPDLNKKSETGLRSSSDGRGERGGRRADRNSNAGSRERGGRERGSRERSGRPRGAEKGFSRFFVNVGKKDGISPKEMIGLINDKTKNRDINVGAIDIKDSFAFFEVGQIYTAEVMDSFNKAEFKGRKLRVEPAEEIQDNSFKGKKRKSKGKR
jgi:ATP-dependent RNA helicase DeaD